MQTPPGPTCPTANSVFYNITMPGSQKQRKETKEKVQNKEKAQEEETCTILCGEGTPLVHFFNLALPTLSVITLQTNKPQNEK